MKKLACFILSYEITRGMKSVGPKALLKSNKSTELINCQISNIADKNIDIYLILGFGAEKVKKKLKYKDVKIIVNELYDSANQGYAFELIMEHYDYHKYDGCIIINNGILFDKDVREHLTKSDRLKSKIYYSNNTKENAFPIGLTIVDSSVGHMFFNLFDNLWKEIVYIDTSSLNKYKDMYRSHMRNMFMFELINKSIELGLKYDPIKTKNNSIIKISSTKDSNKIKETI